MDPISVTGVLAVIVQVIETTATAIRFLNDLKHASKEQALLSYETASLLLLMTNLRSRLEEADRPEWKTWSEGILVLGAKNGALDQVHTAMEELLTKLDKMSNRSKVANTLAWKLEKDECTAILERIERSKTTISLALQGDQLALLRTIKTDTITMTEQAQAMNTSERAQAMQEWMSPLEFKLKQQTLLSKRQLGSGKWFLESPEYLNWFDNSGSNVLWCSGIPGSGKTILSSIIVEDLQKRLKRHSLSAVGYAYCDYNDREVQSIENIIGSLWRQIVHLDQHGVSNLQDLYNRCMIEDRGARPTLRELSGALRDEVNRHVSVFLVIDALDECSEGVRAGLLHEFSQLPETAHILITSRSKHVPPELRNATSLDIKAHEDDITNYVVDRVQTAKRLSAWVKGKVSLVKQIVTSVLKHAKDMFLLAKLFMDSLCSKLTLKGVLKALKSIPNDLNATYDEAMARIARQNEEERDLAYRILYWVTLAYRPITVQELCHALACEPDEDEFDHTNLISEEDIISVCTGLVTIEPHTNIVRMVHYSCQEYMDKILNDRFPESYQDLARTCLTYLTYQSTNARYKGHRFSISTRGTVQIEKVDIACEDALPEMGTYEAAFHWSVPRYNGEGELLPFYQYAIQYWAWHLRECTEQDDLIQDVLKFFSEWKHWYPILSTVRAKWVTYIRSAIDVIAAYQLEQVCTEVVSRPLAYANMSKPLQLRTVPNPEPSEPYPEAGLLVASMLGRATILKILIEKSRSKKAVGRKIDSELFGRLLQAAAWSGNPAAVEKLLEYSPLTDENSSSGVPVQTPFAQDAVIAALSRHGLQPTIPLICSVGSPASIPLALAAGLPIDAVDPQFGRTGLMFAAERGREPFAQALLAPPVPADVNRKSFPGFTPLHYAVLSGQFDVAKLLVDAGADWNAKDNLDRTPLMYAGNYGRRWPGKMPGDFPDITPVQKRWEEVVELLGAKWGRVVQFKGETEKPASGPVF
ncbi:hypothetical protein N7510_003408 [Penicillium lagena]|uniref:uncharacterized protein n=1 Tax=Penicillium lagena TaxID=94218 RepID=UPI002541CABB|nr:uncharacterized protein N7510_003408 [Penicillium lagena]KAJ5619424.1 hypothetical protein N7510_003408 [Penicillium lagena]